MQISPVSPRSTARRVDELDHVPGRGPPHRTRLHGLLRRIADLRCGLGLTVAVADGETPRASNLFDDLGVERLTGAQQLAERRTPRAEVLLDEHPPHRRRSAEAGHRASRERVGAGDARRTSMH